MTEQTHTPPPRAAKGSRRRVPAALLLAMLAIALSVGQAVVGYRQQAANGASQAAVAALQAQVAELESRLGELAARPPLASAAEGDDALLAADIEAGLLQAAQQLQFSGNVGAATLALQAADARLARLDAPAHLALRKAIGRDLERLKAHPYVDLPGLSLRLEHLAAGIDRLPLAALARPPVAPLATPPAAGWAGVGERLWQEVRNLVRIQRFDGEAAPLLAPGQEYFLRENLKLRLAGARLALYAHDPAAFRSEAKAALDTLQRYFAADDAGVQTAQATLRELLPAFAGDAPTLGETLAALRGARNGRDKP